DAQRKEDVRAFFKSIHGTLNHLLVADRIWMGRFVGPPFRVPSLDHEPHADAPRGRALLQPPDPPPRPAHHAPLPARDRSRRDRPHVAAGRGARARVKAARAFTVGLISDTHGLLR